MKTYTHSVIPQCTHLLMSGQQVHGVTFSIKLVLKNSNEYQNSITIFIIPFGLHSSEQLHDNDIFTVSVRDSQP